MNQQKVINQESASDAKKLLLLANKDKSLTSRNNKAVHPIVEKVCDEEAEDIHELESMCPFLTAGIVLSREKADEKKALGAAALNNYASICIDGKDTNLLGRGSFGQVILMKNKTTEKKVAVKIIAKKNLSDTKTLASEINIHKRLMHENIVKLHDFVETEKNLYIVMEYLSGGNLFQYIKRKGKLSEREAFYFFTQICNAVHFLHKNKIIHRDIKPENLLLAEKGIIKLGDFGCCTECEGERTTFCGTAEYIAPELIKRNGYNEKADVWSLGVLLYEMLNGKSPFKGCSERDIFGKVLKGKIGFNSDISADAQEFISAMLSEEPHNRPCIVKLFSFDWMKRLQTVFKIPNKGKPTCNTFRTSMGIKGSDEFATVQTIKQKGVECATARISGEVQRKRTEDEKCGQVHEFLQDDVSTEGSFVDPRTSTKLNLSRSVCIASEVPTHIVYGYPSFSSAVKKIKSENAAQVPKPSTTQEKLKKLLSPTKPKSQTSTSINKEAYWSKVFSFTTEGEL